MASDNDWQHEMRDATRREMWSLTGPGRIVKVVPAGAGAATRHGGYITLGKYLLGKTPMEIEGALGLPPGLLAAGARIYKFVRLPLEWEFEYELTTKYPGGLAFNPAHSDPNYMPGSPTIHQWKIKPGVTIPVNAAYLELKPGDRFAYSWLVA